MGIASTAPVPYFKASNGFWYQNSRWAIGQKIPPNHGQEPEKKHIITLNTNSQLKELTFDNN